MAVDGERAVAVKGRTRGRKQKQKSCQAETTFYPGLYLGPVGLGPQESDTVEMHPNAE
jgi:hypothetical protein